jgi:hypothetical protein
MTPLVAHIMGLPVEEGLLGLAPAGGLVVGAAAIACRARLEELVGWLRRR